MTRRSAPPLDRARQVARLLRSEGGEGVVRRVRERIADRVAPPGGAHLPVSDEDFRRAARHLALGAELPRPLPWDGVEPLRIAWVDVPPGPGSGGQTTIYRMVRALESAGHTCSMYLLNQHGWHLDQHRRVIGEWWPDVRADVRDVRDGIEDCHAIFATCWESVYPVIASEARGARLYFVQDFEPLFTAAGSESLLADATYRLGLHGVTAGRWLADKLTREYAMPCHSFDFGCDLTSYTLDPHDPEGDRRTDICYYARPSTPRRAHELSVKALALFAEAHPEVEIHLYGEAIGVPFRAQHHGLLTPKALGGLYQRCIAGLTLSATNVSLVPHEMLAAGCIPVVNDAEHNRVVLDNDHVAYALATPFSLAAELSRLVESSPVRRAERARLAAGSVTGRSWDDAGREIERVVREVVATQLRPIDLRLPKTGASGIL